MPSVEFLDVREWQESLRRVVAVELESDVVRDMKIEMLSLKFPFPVKIVEDDVLDFLVEVDQGFDVYNLDFYGGFIYPTKARRSRAVEAFEALFIQQKKGRRGFVLSVTFNVRSRGESVFAEFLEQARQELCGRRNVGPNLNAHAERHARKLKLCFQYFCWQQSQLHGFSYSPGRAFRYKSGDTELVHFCERFVMTQGLLRVPAASALVDVANRPLWCINGVIPRVAFSPTRIE